MSKFISDLPATNPDGFLKLIYRIDPLAAIRVANKWGESEATPQQGHAAWALICRQTLVPLCTHCQWALFEDDPHMSCDEALVEQAWDKYYTSQDEDEVSTTEVYSRAYAHFGNQELAREAAELYPGDFI